MKVFYFKRKLGKIIPLCCLLVLTCWGVYGAYLGEPLSLRAGASVGESPEEGVSIALKIDNGGKIKGEDAVRLAKELKAKRLTDVNMFFTKAWVQAYPESYRQIVKKGIKTGVWWYDRESLRERPVDIEIAAVYIQQTGEIMSELAGEPISLYLESEQYSREERENLAARLPYQGVIPKEKLEGMRISEKLARVEETAEIGTLYCDNIYPDTVTELEQIREILQSKHMELVEISKNKALPLKTPIKSANPVIPNQVQKENGETGEIHEQTGN